MAAVDSTPEVETAAAVKPAPTLYAIIAIKLAKGLLFFGLAMVAYTLSDNDLPADFRNLLHHLRLNPERKFWADLARSIGRITEPNLLWAAAGTLVYSLFSLVEGIGLIFRVSWAGWLAIGESMFFIPIEVYELLIVWYLLKNRHRLFRHHHFHQTEPNVER